jgi:hypothetical protein
MSFLGLRQESCILIKASVSWRSTAILRWLATKFPGLARQMRRIVKLLWWAATFQLVSRVRAWRRRRVELKLISSSGLFDRDWYWQTYLDVRQADVDPMLHYLAYGANEGRDPNPPFDSGWYLSRYPDVAAAGINSLLHYIQRGLPTGAFPVRSFVVNGRRRNNPGMSKTFLCRSVASGQLVRFTVGLPHHSRFVPHPQAI